MQRKIFFARVAMALAGGLLFAVPVFSQCPQKTMAAPKTAYFDSLDLRTFQPNLVKMDVQNQGMFVSYARTGNAGMEWPAGSGKTIDFSSGFWLVGKVGESTRTAVAEYAAEFVPGTAVNGVPADPNDPRFRIYSITRTDLDAALDDDPETVPGDDYLNWPFADGAPRLKTADGRDSLDARGNLIPELLGDAALWCVFNDFDSLTHKNVFKTDPLGVEVRLYAWGYEHYLGGSAVFVRFRIFNRDQNTVDPLYFGVFADPDVGYPSDDFCGVDTLLQVGYSWNNGADPDYGVRAPAFGIQLLQGPLVPDPGKAARAFDREFSDFQNLPLYAFNKYI